GLRWYAAAFRNHEHDRAVPARGKRQMIKNLTSSERQTAAIMLVLVALAGFAMAIGGRGDPLGIHGFIVILFAGALLYPVLAAFYAPEPTEDRAASYYDDPIKVGVVIAM